MGQFVKALFSCQVYEKPSIQNCVSLIAENCLTHFVEPTFFIYSLNPPTLSQAASNLENILPSHLVDNELLKRGAANVERRVRLQKSCLEEVVRLFSSALFNVSFLLSIQRRVLTAIAQSAQTHWKYSIVAIRCLRTLVQREQPIHVPQLKYVSYGFPTQTAISSTIVSREGM